jgi:hypothetical protein
MPTAVDLATFVLDRGKRPDAGFPGQFPEGHDRLGLEFRHTLEHSSSEAVIDLQQHLFDYATPGLRSQKLKRNLSLKSGLWSSQPSRRLRFITEDLFSLRSYTCYPDSAVRLVASQRLVPNLPVCQSSPGYNEAVDLFIAYSIAGERVH